MDGLVLRLEAKRVKVNRFEYNAFVTIGSAEEPASEIARRLGWRDAPKIIL